MGECQNGGQTADQEDVRLAAFHPLSNLNTFNGSVRANWLEADKAVL